jgi:hypothetical protein
LPENGLVPCDPRSNGFKLGEGTQICPPGVSNPGEASVTPTDPNYTPTTAEDECCAKS